MISFGKMYLKLLNVYTFIFSPQDSRDSPPFASEFGSFNLCIQCCLEKIIFSWGSKILTNQIIPESNPKTDPQYNVTKVQLGETISFLSWLLIEVWMRNCLQYQG